MKSEFLRVDTVAKRLNVSKKRVYAMVQEGKLEALRFGPRQMRIPRQSVEDLIELDRHPVTGDTRVVRA